MFYLWFLRTISKIYKNLKIFPAKYGELECLKVLIANSINLELVDEHGMNVSHIAARFNHPKIIEYLFNLGYRLDEPSNDGKLPVHYVRFNKHLF